jgi:hypothetical protein
MLCCGVGLNYLPLPLRANVMAAGDGYQPPEYAIDGDRVFLRGCLKVRPCFMLDVEPCFSRSPTRLFPSPSPSTCTPIHLAVA